MAKKKQTIKPTFDVYFSEVDGTCVVHIDTEGMPENDMGPIMRVYINDGDSVYENPRYESPQLDERVYNQLVKS